MRKIYKPGDNVLPKLRRRRRPEDDDDRRLMDEVRQLSLQDAGVDTHHGSLEPPRPRHTSARSRSSERSGRRHRSRESSASGVESHARPPRVSPSTLAGPPTARQLEHQSSIRSLLSASELDSQELEDEILRQIMDEGLLEGIDLDNIDRTQEEEIQERILQAFRRRRREQRATGQQSESAPTRSQGTSDNEVSHSEAAHNDSRSDLSHQSHGSRPPISRPHLFNAVNEAPRTHRRRTSSQGSSRSARPDTQNLDLPSSSETRASRSASDLSLDHPRIEGSSERPRRASASNRRTTDPVGHPRLPTSERAHRTLPERRTNSNPASPNPTQTHFQTHDTRAHATFPITRPSALSTTRAASHSSAISSSSTAPTPSQSHPSTAAESHLRNRSRNSLFIEPNITCEHCHKPHIEYFRHYYCSKCPSSIPSNLGFSVCLSCYRQLKGCHHWYGYTPASAAIKHARQAFDLPPSMQAEEPHMLVGRRYRKPQQPLVRSSVETGRMVTDEDPASRLEEGVFCDSCGVFSNTCYWKCDICNDGAWGYCNDCTNQFKHCTHPLLPLSHKSLERPASARTQDSNTGANHHQTESTQTANTLEPPLTPKSASPLGGIPPTIISNLSFTPQEFATDCDICHNSIPPSHTRFHCPDCNKGDYDICASCYNALVAKGRIRREDGPHGWRRCPQGHRMGIIGFEDREGGRWRIVSAERVGGLALKEEVEHAYAQGSGSSWSWRDDDGTLRRGTSHSRNPSRSPLPSPGLPPTGLSATGGLDPPVSSQQQHRFPPSGGVGLKVQALYAWWPEEGTSDELMFPKGAEIREVEDINNDWFWGCYAGAKGLFPGNYGRVIGRVE